MDIPILSPIDDTEVGRVSPTPLDTLPNVFRAANDAAKTWSAMPVQDRVSALQGICDLILDQKDKLTETIHRENGKPRMEAISHDLLPSLMLARYFLDAAPKILAEKDLTISNAILLHRRSKVLPTPLGTVLIIAPWNFPFYLPFGEIFMSLLAGNAVVFKPSEITPLAGIAIQNLLDSLSLPKGLLQTVIGDGKTGAALIAQKPDKIFFTGSVETGKAIASAAAAHLIPVNLELGGKNSILVLKDADLDHATSAVLWGVACNAGQACSASSRVFVDTAVRERFLTLLVNKAKALKLGPKGEMAMITLRSQKARYDRHLNDAKNAGAETLCGGVYAEGDRQLVPTVIYLEDNDDLSVCREETFGPVVAVSSFETEQEAITRANQSRYGLVASVMTRDDRRGQAIASQLVAGSVMVNEVVYSIAIPEAPWGGPKLSGSGLKHSDEGLLQFTRPLHIHHGRWNRFRIKSPWWYPYTPIQFALFRQYMELYRTSSLRRLLSLPMLIWLGLRFFLKEPRR